MDFCSGLLIFCLVLFVIALVGHGLWMMGVVVVRAMTGHSDDREHGPERHRPVRVCCPRCSTFHVGTLRHCPSCGLTCNGPLADELRELESAVKSLQSLQDRGSLESALAEKVYQQIEARQNQLLREDVRPNVTSESADAEEEPPIADVPEVKPAPIEPSEAPVEVPIEPATPRRSWSEMFAAFMEERNIMWGELVGGLLIVGCSIALVVSLWRTLEEQIHSFPFLVMTALTAGLFAAGQYSLRHWKLEATSRGLLVITSLLTPLSFLVLAGLSPGRITGWVDWLLGLGAVATYGAMVAFAGRVTARPVLTPDSRRSESLLALAVVGASASQLLVPRDFAGYDATILLSYIPVVLQALAITGLLIAKGSRPELTPIRANALHLFLAQAAFATAIALSFLVYQSHEPISALQHLAIPVAIAGWPALIIGAMTYAGVARTADATEGDCAVPRITGTVIAIVGALAVLSSLALAWPRPAALSTLGFVNGLLFFAVAFVYRWPIIHIGAAASIAVGILTSYLWARGELFTGPDLSQRLLMANLSPAGALGLTLLAGVLALISEVLARMERWPDARIYISAAGLAGLAAIVVTIRNGLIPARYESVFVFGLIGVGALLVNLRWRRAELTLACSLLLLAFNEQMAGWLWPDVALSHRWLFSLLAHATVFVIGGILSSLSHVGRSIFGRPMLITAWFTSAMALVPLWVDLSWDHLTLAGVGNIWLAALWIVFATYECRPGLFAGGQVVLMLASLLAIVEWMLRRDWISASLPDPFTTTSMQMLAFGPAVLGVGWAMARLVARHTSRGGLLLEPPSGGIDRLALVLLVIGQYLIAAATLYVTISTEILGSVANVHHDPPSLVSAWSLFGVLAVGLGLGLWTKNPQEPAIALFLLLTTVPLWIAHRYRDQAAAATALRWSLALAFIVLSVPFWFDTIVGRVARRLGIDWPEHSQARPFRKFIVVAFTLLPLVGLTVWIGNRVLAGHPVPGLEIGTTMVIGWTALLIAPLAIAALGMLVHSVRDRSSINIFATTALLVLAICGGDALLQVTLCGSLDTGFLVRLIWLGVTVIATSTLVWLIPGWSRGRNVLGIQAGIAGVTSIVVLACIVIQMLEHVGGRLPPWILSLSNDQPLDWLAVGLTSVASALVVGLRSARKTIHVLAIAGMGFGILAATLVARHDPSGWMSYHVLTVSGIILALLLLILAWLGEVHHTPSAKFLKNIIPAWPARRWVEILCAIVVLLAWGGAWNDPGQPYWSSATTFGVSTLFAAMAVWMRRPAYVYVAGLGLQCVAYFFWQSQMVEQWGVQSWMLFGPGVTDRFILLQALALASGSAIWSIVESALRRRTIPIDVRSSFIPYVYLSVWLALQLVGIIILAAMLSNFFEFTIRPPIGLTWWVLAVTAFAFVMGFRDPESHSWGMPAAGLYVCGSFALGFLVHQLSLTPADFVHLAGPTIAIYVLFVSWLVRYWPTGISQRLGFATTIESRLDGWYQLAQTVYAGGAIALSFWMCTNGVTLTERMAAPMTVSLLFVATLLPALNAVDDWAKFFPRRFQTVTLGTLFLVVLAWSWIDPAGPAPWLHRHAWLFLVLCSVAAVCATILPAYWQDVGRTSARYVGMLAAVDLVAFLIHELMQYDPIARRTPLGRFDMGLVAGMLFISVVILIRTAAARPKSGDAKIPFRKGCVWVAELLVVLLLLHLRLNVPDLFPSFFGRHWHFVIMAVSFAGIGLAELFRRRGLAPLADPLQQTGLFLPLLPIVAYLIRPLADLTQLSHIVPGLQPLLRYVDRLPNHFGIHSVLWFMLGSLYALVAVFRRATGYALAAALAANFGLWVLYANDPEWSFRVHPQLWLLPIGLILLVAEYLNRDRVPKTTAATVRMAGLLIVYGSSSADMFIAGLGHSIVLPVLLAILSIVGVFAGILFRVRGYLLAGVAFLFLVVLSQIWHAAVHRQQTWVWWASGIVLGLSIIFLFAIFERRRDSVVKYLEDMKHWH